RAIATRAPRAVTHLKIDVEGHEAVIVPGNREWLMDVRPLLFLELHGDLIRSRGQDPLGVLTVLRESGYERFEHLGRPITAECAAALPLARLVGFPSSQET